MVSDLFPPDMNTKLQKLLEQWVSKETTFFLSESNILSIILYLIDTHVNE